MKKRICLGAFFAIAVLLFSACGGESDFRDNTREQWFREAVKYRGAVVQEKMAQIDVQKLKLKEKMGDASLYPQFFASVKMASLAGKRRKQAIEVVKQWNISKAALAWYATEQGFFITKEEAEERLEKRLAEIQTTEEYQEIESKYEEEGITLGESMGTDLDTYWQNFMIEDLAADRYQRYTQGELTQGEALDWEKYWEEFKRRVVRKYEKTERCKAQKKALLACETLYPAEDKEILENDQRIRDTEWEIPKKR